MKFKKLTIRNFGSFQGKHTFVLDRPPGLYYVMGENLIEPELGANGCGKSTLLNSFFYAWTGKTLQDNRPGASIEPWDGFKGSLYSAINFDDHTLLRSRKPNTLALDAEDIDQSKIPYWLGMSEENLRRTILVGQKSDLFLDLRPEEQSRMFTDMLNLEIWLSAAELAGKKAIAEDKLAAEQERIATELQGRIAGLQSQLEIEQKQDTDFTRSKKQKITQAKEKVKSSRKNLEDHKDTKLVFEGKDISALEEKLNKSKVQLAKAQKDIEKPKELVIQLNTKIQGTLRVIKAYEEVDDDACPECGQTVDAAHIKERIKYHQKLSKQISEDREEPIDAVAALEAAIDRLKEVIEKAEIEIRKESKRKQFFDEELNSWKRQLTRLQTELQSDERDLKTFVDMENPHSQNIKTMEDRLEKYDGDRDSAASRYELHKWKSTAYRFWQQSYKEIRLNIIDQTLIEIEVAANRHAESLGLKDWRIEFATEKQTASDRVSRGFVTLIYPPSQDQPIRWETVSGGEGTRWQLAVTFALSEILLMRAGLTTNVELIDEPTRHLDQNGIDDLLEALRDRAHDLKRAIFFIDHRSLDRGNFDGIILIQKDETGSHIIEN